MAAILIEAEGDLTSEFLDLAQLRFLMTFKGNKDPEGTKAKVMKQITENNMAPLYKKLCDQLKWSPDAALLSTMETANADELKKLDETLENAETNEGESEIRIALLARADYYMKIGDKEKALEKYDETFKKTVALGQRLDILFSKLRLGLFFMDMKLILEQIDKAKALLEQGGDWERRNRLKVYEAAYLISIRDFKKAGTLLLDSVATFTAYELFSYNEFVFYTVVTCLLTLDRETLKKKVVDAPEILAVILEIPHLKDFLNGLYDCNYRQYMEALVGIMDQVHANRYMNQHARYYWREARIAAYTQFLQSYRSVNTESMAASFGVSSDFLDAELSQFISSGRLAAKIDKVSGVVATNRPDNKNAQYQTSIKQGDLLLNRIQKLSRVINV